MNRTPRLLVSVQDRAEAELAQATGVHWIDLKNPLAGALGAPTTTVARAVADCIEDRAQSSVALGELNSLNDSRIADVARLFPWIKVGLSETAGNHWQADLSRIANLVDEHGSKLVPGLYADWQDAHSPHPQEMVEYVASHKMPALLIDTFLKNGSGLLDHLALGDIERLSMDLHNVGCELVLAGSLKLESLAELASLPLLAIGIRGAVCQNGRQSKLCPEKLQQAVDMASRWQPHPGVSSTAEVVQEP